jgi:predicted MFS family arabinose efflux permease
VKIGALVAGCSATLLGIGLQRFAYAPLLPAMVQAGWLPAGEAGALGAANLGGYLLGAFGAGWVAHRAGLVPALRGAMLVASACFALCALRGGLLWFLPWRVMAGAAGGVLVVLAGPAVQAAMAPAHRGVAAGIVFGGVGIGIVCGAVLVPLLLPAGLPQAWLALSAAGLALTALSWRRWPTDGAPPRRVAGDARAHHPGSLRLLLAYALSAVTVTPQMLWWPDFIVRGLHRETHTAAVFWVAFGAAAACGPALCGRLGDGIGTARAFALVLVLQSVAVGLPLLSVSDAALLASSVLCGAASVGATALALTRTKEVAGIDGLRLWRTSTAAYGGARSVAGFAMAWLYAATGSHLYLFWAGLAVSFVALFLGRK